MRSNICKIEKGSLNADQIFLESEKVARYNDLDHKQTLQLRLLCEELVNMLPSIVSNFRGEFWIENQGNQFELCMRASVENIDMDTRERLINVSKKRKNSAKVGIALPLILKIIKSATLTLVQPPMRMVGQMQLKVCLQSVTI